MIDDKLMTGKEIHKLCSVLESEFPGYSRTQLTIALATLTLYDYHVSLETQALQSKGDAFDEVAAALFTCILKSFQATVDLNNSKTIKPNGSIH